MNKKSFALLFISILTLSTFALTEEEENASNKEAGAYERKSISYANTLWLMDGSTRRIPSGYIVPILNKVKRSVEMKRFDYNPLPSSLTSLFTDEANSHASSDKETMVDTLTAVMNRTLVPKIVDIVDAEKEMRALGLLTEQQKNSFITDKAKETGITASELKTVMNSAYVYLPVARRYREWTGKGDTTYNAFIEIGVIWWNIEFNDSGSQARVISSEFIKGSGSTKVGKSYMHNGKTISYKKKAMMECISEVGMNLRVATKEIEQFKLTSQVGEKNFATATFFLGDDAGVKVDDKYLIIKKTELDNGDVVNKKSGWIRVTKVGNKENGNKSKAAIVSGVPSIGTELKEYPRIPIDISLKGRNYRFSVEPEEKPIHDSLYRYIKDLELKDGWGAQLQLSVNLGRMFNVPQFFLSAEFGVGFLSPSGIVYNNSNDRTSLSADSLFHYSFAFGGSITKKFFIRRVGLVLDPMIGAQYLFLEGPERHDWDDTDYKTRWKNYSIGVLPRGGLEFAITPFMNIGASAGYQFSFKSPAWIYEEKEKDKDGAKWGDIDVDDKDISEFPTVNYNGYLIQFYLTFSPPRLPGNILNKGKKTITNRSKLF